VYRCLVECSVLVRILMAIFAISLWKMQIGLL
jgi:hypothetical protein